MDEEGQAELQGELDQMMADNEAKQQELDAALDHEAAEQ